MCPGLSDRSCCLSKPSSRLPPSPPPDLHQHHLPLHVSNSNQTIQTPPSDRSDSGMLTSKKKKKKKTFVNSPQLPSTFYFLLRSTVIFRYYPEMGTGDEMEQGAYLGKDEYDSRDSKSRPNFHPISASCDR